MVGVVNKGIMTLFERREDFLGVARLLFYVSLNALNWAMAWDRYRRRKALELVTDRLIFWISRPWRFRAAERPSTDWCDPAKSLKEGLGTKAAQKNQRVAGQLRAARAGRQISSLASVIPHLIVRCIWLCY